MTSRRSSGSSRVDSAVEPTRSQNITVSWRRSAPDDAGAAGLGCGAIDGGDGAAAPSSLVPHCAQNFEPAAFA